MRRRASTVVGPGVGRWLLLAMIAAFAVSAQGQGQSRAAVSSPAGHDLITEAAFDHFYNMDYDRATQDFQKISDKRPDDPAAVNHLLTSVLMHELYRMGAMNTGEYANDSFIGEAHRPADPKVKEQIQQLARRAESLEEQQLKANPNSVDALYARGVTRAQFAVYTGLVERAWFSALRNAVGARHDHERVLELSPGYVDAKLVVGTHNYVMGSLPWSVKVAVALVGLSGSKEKGLQYLREVAASNGENAVDAKIVLSLFLRREHSYDEARGIMHDLAARYPRNYLFPLEEANLLRASRHDPEAAAAYRKVWQNGREGKYGALHYETTAWGLGPRWTSDGIKSTGWCDGAKIESVADEAVGRLQDLNGHSHEAMCKQYVNDVVASNRINADTGCGFSGPDFNPKIVDHENWCRGAKPDEVYSEERHRFMSMDHCTTCEFYASEAERFRGIQKVRGCKLSGPRWSNAKVRMYAGACKLA